MDKKLAKQMFNVGGILVFLDVPKGTSFGIDMKTWFVGEKFKGVKMIPPGIHFIHFSAVNKEGDVAPRTGFFHYFEEREVLVKNYVTSTEDIVSEEDEEQVQRIKANLESMDEFLGPYPVDEWDKWVALVQYISLNDLRRLQPLSGKLCSAAELIYKDTSTHEDSSLSEGIKGTRGDAASMIQRPETEIRFTKFPPKPYKDGATPSEITRGSIDSSYSLNHMFNHIKRPHDVLSELQFSFVCFLVGQIWEGFEQWKKLIVALCKAEDCLVQNTAFYSSLISVLHHQIQYVPEDLFVDITENENFLAMSLINLATNISDNLSSLPIDFVTKAYKFRKHIAKKFKWNLSIEEEGENAPVVVQ